MIYLFIFYHDDLHDSREYWPHDFSIQHLRETAHYIFRIHNESPEIQRCKIIIAYLVRWYFVHTNWFHCSEYIVRVCVPMSWETVSEVPSYVLEYSVSTKRRRYIEIAPITSHRKQKHLHRSHESWSGKFGRFIFIAFFCHELIEFNSSLLMF